MNIFVSRCQICPYRSRDSSQLTVHLRTHTGTNMYLSACHVHLMAHPFTFQIKLVEMASEVASYCNCSLTSVCFVVYDINLLKPTDYVMHQQFNIQQLYALPTLYLSVLYLSENNMTCATYSINWLVFITEMKCLQHGMDWALNKAVCASSLKG